MAVAVEKGQYLNSADFLLGATMGTLISVLLSLLVTSAAAGTEALSTGGEVCLDKKRNARNGNGGFPVAI